MKRLTLAAGATARARSLRRAATPEERLLWNMLRRHMPAAKFRRQVPIGRYFVDFISHSAKLVIELDGSQHALHADYDLERTRFLESEGYRVVRFWNRDIAGNLDGVFRAIEAALAKSPSPPVGEGGPKDRMRGNLSSNDPSPQPSPTRGEGELDNLQVGVS